MCKVSGRTMGKGSGFVALLVEFSLGALVRLLMIDHVAEFWSLDVTEEATKKLVGAPRPAILHELLGESQVARVVPILVACPPDDLLQGLVGVWTHRI